MGCDAQLARMQTAAVMICATLVIHSFIHSFIVYWAIFVDLFENVTVQE